VASAKSLNKRCFHTSTSALSHGLKFLRRSFQTIVGANVFPLVSNVNFWLLVGLSSGSISLVEK